MLPTPQLKQGDSSGSPSQTCYASWIAPLDLQRPDWEPHTPGGCVDLGYRQIHGMTCDDARVIAAARDLLEACKLAIERTPPNSKNLLPVLQAAVGKALGHSLHNVQSVPPADEKTPPKPQDD